MSQAFPGGVHPHDHKALSKDAALANAPVPAEVVIPFSQHIGKPASPVVKPTDKVKRGQVIAEAAGFVSAAVHSSVSGTVKKIVQVNHPLGMVVDAALIENDGRDEWADGVNEERDAFALSPEAIVKAVQEAGIVGMGGATFPTHVKLSPPKDKPIDTVLLNGIECEPYLTADHRLMLESPETIVKGMRLVLKAVKAQKGIVGIEANKPDAFETINRAIAATGDPSLSAQLLPVMYPQGGEKQLIYACLKREVPSGGLPMDSGALVQNVATCHAIYEACALRRPLTERITTITGEGIGKPSNLRVRIGTPISVLLEACQFDADKTRKLILGGPMTGPAHYDTSIPVAKGSGGVLALTDAAPTRHRDCIRCGRCVDACPMSLIPSEISIYGEAGDYLQTQEVDILDCIECGACTYICPARRPIVQWIKVSKGELARKRAEEMAAKT